MTTFKQVQLLNFMLDHHPHLYVEYVHNEGYRLRGSNSVRECTNNINDLLTDIWNALGYNTAPLYGMTSNTEWLRARTGVDANDNARFELIYTNIRAAADASNIAIDLSFAYDEDHLRTVHARRYVNTKRFKALRGLLRGWNSLENKIVRRGNIALIPRKTVDAA
jgi:hypothetical protein